MIFMIVAIVITALIYFWMLANYFAYDTDYDRFKDETSRAIEGFRSYCHNSFDFDVPRDVYEKVGVLKVECEKIKKIDFSLSEDPESSVYTICKGGFFGFPLCVFAVICLMCNLSSGKMVLCSAISAVLAFVLLLIFGPKEDKQLSTLLSEKIRRFNDALEDYNKVPLDMTLDSIDIRHNRLWYVIRQFHEIASVFDGRVLQIKLVGGISVTVAVISWFVSLVI